MKHFITSVIFFTLFLLSQPQAEGCTVGVVSGKYTSDGRPLIWKNRDSNTLDNVYIYVTGGKYNYTAVVPIGDMAGKRVLYGHNEAGFAVMNSTANNIRAEKGAENNPLNANVMRQGLAKCATVAEFVEMIRELVPHTYGSNYGCFDAQGNVAIVEVGKNGVHVYDANDPEIAPHGYIVRSNYAMSHDSEGGGGFCRYEAATELFEQAYLKNNLNWKEVLSFSRSLKHGYTKQNLYDVMPRNDKKEVISYFQDFIPRFSTASSVVIQGVKEGEPPILTTSWVMIGSPLTTVIVPVWMADNHNLPACVSRDENVHCEMLSLSNILKDNLFSIKNKEGQSYIKLNLLINKKKTGILQKVISAEKEIIEKGVALQQQFRKDGAINNSLSDDYYKWLDEYVINFYKNCIEEL